MAHELKTCEVSNFLKIPIYLRLATGAPLALKIEITSLPSALRCCCIVLELNLQDPSKHQVKLLKLKIFMPIRVTLYFSSAANSVLQSGVPPPSEACSGPLVTMPS